MLGRSSDRGPSLTSVQGSLSKSSKGLIREKKNTTAIYPHRYYKINFNRPVNKQEVQRLAKGLDEIMPQGSNDTKLAHKIAMIYRTYEKL
jgi:hypothetical protein